MSGGKSGLFPSLEKQREEWERERSLERKKSCPMRHPENGNCLPVGGLPGRRKRADLQGDAHGV